LASPQQQECTDLSKKNGKFQLIINVQFLNEFLKVPKFKYKGLKELTSMVCEGDWTATIDFHDGFQHIEIDPTHQHLLSIEWRGQCYTFTVLPFGLSASLWAFTCFV
jgi:hypothetical protein